MKTKMKSNKQIHSKIKELKKQMSNFKKLNNNVDITKEPVGFGWYIGNVVSIEKIRHEIKLLEWVLK
jgi:hypothetical protein